MRKAFVLIGFVSALAVVHPVAAKNFFEKNYDALKSGDVKKIKARGEWYVDWAKLWLKSCEQGVNQITCADAGGKWIEAAKFYEAAGDKNKAIQLYRGGINLIERDKYPLPAQRDKEFAQLRLRTIAGGGTLLSSKILAVEHLESANAVRRAEAKETKDPERVAARAAHADAMAAALMGVVTAAGQIVAGRASSVPAYVPQLYSPPPPAQPPAAAPASTYQSHARTTYGASGRSDSGEPVDDYGRSCGTVTQGSNEKAGNDTIYNFSARNSCSQVIFAEVQFPGSNRTYYIQPGSVQNISCAASTGCQGKISYRFGRSN